MKVPQFSTAAVLSLVMTFGQLTFPAVAQDVARITPSAAGLKTEVMEQIDPLIATAIEQNQLPGCVIVVGRPAGIAWSRVYGNKRVEPDRIAMTEDTVFDLASLTKPLATATSVMKLVEMQRLSVDDSVARYIPEFAVEGKGEVTIRDLLVHRSGLIPDNALQDYLDGPAKARERLFSLKLIAPLRSSFKYSDVNFMILGELVNRISGEPLQDFARKSIFAPLEMNDTGYLPAESLRARAAPTERRNGEWIQGQVHDPRAFHLDGVAGHAGLFGTAGDLSRYAMDALAGIQQDQSRILKQSTWRAMIEPHLIEGPGKDGQLVKDIRGLGWDIQSRYSSNRGTKLSPGAFGHGGFTGTCLWIDPDRSLFVVFLSNRVHPNGKGLVNPLIGKITDIIVHAIQE